MSQAPIQAPTTGTVSGLVIAQDINAAFLSQATLLSGASAPTAGGLSAAGSTVSSLAGFLWHDTTNKVLNIRNQADTAWIPISFIDETNGLTRDPILVRGSTVVDVVNTVTETAIFTTSIPGNLLLTTLGLRLKLIGDYLNNSGGASNLEIKVKYGATTIFDTGVISMSAGATRRVVDLEFMMVAQNATNAQVSKGTLQIGATGTVAGVAASSAFYFIAAHNSIAEDSTAAKTFQVTVQHGTAASTISGRHIGATLEWL